MFVVMSSTRVVGTMHSMSIGHDVVLRSYIEHLVDFYLLYWSVKKPNKIELAVDVK